MLKCSKIPCLQYADDIVLMNESKIGLQNCLNKLNEYCCRWEMKINTSKTQVMIFSKKRNLLHNFMMNDCVLNNVDSYKYLGCMFSTDRNFKKCVELLSDKARRATFAVKKVLKCNTLSPKHVFSLFDKLIVPIMTYGAEIWGGSIFTKFNKLSMQDFIPSEKVHRHFIKYVLGVHNKASNAGIMAETGRTPIVAETLKLFVNYADRLRGADKNSLLYEANELAVELEKNKSIIKC